VAVRLSCQLENGGQDAAPALGIVLTGWRDVLFFAFANCEYRRRNFAAYREHHSRSKGRDCEIESGAPVVGGHKQKSTAQPRHTMSAAGRKRIAAAQRARWAKIRAAKKG
jgi:hypothetical protein